MGICCSKDDSMDEKKVLLDVEEYTEDEVSELGQCDWCRSSRMIKYGITGDNESLCKNCEFLYAVRRGRGGMESLYEINLDS